MIQGFRRPPQETELNITTFMNLMVVLVPFLLLSAVFSEITTLQLNLPPNGAAGENIDKPQLQLELILRGKDVILNNGATNKPLDRIPAREGELDIKGLSEALYRLKLNNPEHTEITLLLEPDTKYAPLITLMDAVRSKMIARGLTTDEVAMFPDISIGDAPGFTQPGGKP